MAKKTEVETPAAEQKTTKKRPNYKRKITKPTNNLERKIAEHFVKDKVFYADNEVGEIVRNYLIWCGKAVN